MPKYIDLVFLRLQIRELLIQFLSQVTVGSFPLFLQDFQLFLEFLAPQTDR